MVQRTSKVHPDTGGAFRPSVVRGRNCQLSVCSQARCRRREHRQHHGYRQEQHILHLESYAQNRSIHEKWRRPFAETDCGIRRPVPAARGETLSLREEPARPRQRHHLLHLRREQAQRGQQLRRG